MMNHAAVLENVKRTLCSENFTICKETTTMGLLRLRRFTLESEILFLKNTH